MGKPLPNSTAPLITIGRITGAFGVKGWVHLASFTSPEQNLFQLTPIYLDHQGRITPIHWLHHQAHQKAWVAQFRECGDRDEALALRGSYIKVAREQLPVLPHSQYYWADLEGLRVQNTRHQLLGQVDHLFNTGANDIMAIKKGSHTLCIPFILEHIVKKVDLEQGVITVDWDEDF